MKAAAVVVGAGIAGVSTAQQLSARSGHKPVILVDPLPPLTLTSDKSAECFRNWWPNQAMVGLMNRSIEIMESFVTASRGSFHLNRRGYLYVTAREEKLASMLEEAELIESLGGGPGDVYRSGAELRDTFPFLTDEAVGGVHARNAGWFSAQQLGAFMLSLAQDEGTELIRDRVIAVEVVGDEVSAVVLEDGGRIETQVVVNAAGPMIKPVASMIGIDLPVFSEVHIKMAFRDYLGVIPRTSPMMIWSDPQSIDWSDEEREWLHGEGRSDLLEEMPPACHYRPEGGEGSQWVIALWEYHRLIQEPTWPLPNDALYPEAVIRGLTRAVPGLRAYKDRLPQPMIDGGYYTKTAENRPLVSPLPIGGAFLVGAFSGFGVMSAAGAGELAAQLITGADLPDYAPAFDLRRYQDPGYRAEVAATTNTGQI